MLGTRAVILWSPNLSLSVSRAACVEAKLLCVSYFFISGKVSSLHLECLIYNISIGWNKNTASKERCDSTAGGSIWHLLFDRADWTNSRLLDPSVCAASAFFAVHGFCVLVQRMCFLWIECVSFPAFSSYHQKCSLNATNPSCFCFGVHPVLSLQANQLCFFAYFCASRIPACLNSSRPLSPSVCWLVCPNLWVVQGTHPCLPVLPGTEQTAWLISLPVCLPLFCLPVCLRS